MDIDFLRHVSGWQFCLYLLTFISAAIPLIYENLKPRNRGILLSLSFLTFLITIGQTQKENFDQDTRLYSDLLDRQRKHDSLMICAIETLDSVKRTLENTKSIIDTSNRIAQLQYFLSEKSDKIEELQGSALNNITGGDNFPIIQFIAIDPNSLMAGLSNRNPKLPIRQLTVEVEVLFLDKFTKFQDGSEISQSPDAHFTQQFIIGDMPIMSKKHLLDWKFKEPHNHVMYIYRVNWLNGFYVGKFSIRQTEDGRQKIYDNIVINSSAIKLTNLIFVNTEAAKINKVKSTIIRDVP